MKNSRKFFKVQMLSFFGATFLALLAPGIAIVHSLVKAHLRNEAWLAQGRTVSDMLPIATALEFYHSDKGVYPLRSADLAALVSTYITGLRGDGWGSPYHYHSDGQHYVLASPGEGGRFEKNYVEVANTAKVVDAFYGAKGDIIFADGKFVAFPAGL